VSRRGFLFLADRKERHQHICREHVLSLTKSKKGVVFSGEFHEKWFITARRRVRWLTYLSNTKGGKEKKGFPIKGKKR